MKTLLLPIARVLCAIPLLLAAGGIFAQSSSPTIACDRSSESVCDKIDNMNVQFLLSGIDETVLKSYSQLVIVCEFGNAETTLRYDCKNAITNLTTDNTSLGTLASDTKTGSASRTLTIKSASLVNSALDQLALSIAEPSSLVWTVYATPIASDALPQDDPQRLSILNDASLCGFQSTIQTGSAWADFSSYEWTIQDNANFYITALGDSAILGQRRTEGGLYASSVRTTTVTVKQTVGGVCSATYSKQITLLGNPDVTLEIDQSAHPDGSVLICSTASDADDYGRDFSGYVTASGSTPMSVTLTTGDKFTFTQNGRQAFSNAHVSQPGRVTILQAVDVNGCSVGATTTDYVHGGISVYDRKPAFSFPTDSLYTQTTTVAIAAEAESDADNFKWGVLSQYRDYNAGVSSMTSSATLWSNMRGKIGFFALEVVPASGNMPECASDTAFVNAYFEMPLRYPNAISPNGDGKNDRLVIEALPANNQLFIFDSRGKTVFQKTNYRNNWGAQGVDDGYYVYVLKGDGIKTIKETLAIKRTIN